jgi:hypothetical protein
VPSVGTWSCQISERTLLMSHRWCALSGYVILSNIQKNSANVTAPMCPQWVCVILLNIWKNSADVMVPMCPQPVRDPVKYLKNLANVTVVMCPQEVCDPVEYLKLGSCHGGHVPSGSTWSCWIFERTQLMLQRGCQRVCDPVEYLKELGSCHDGDVPSAGT